MNKELQKCMEHFIKIEKTILSCNTPNQLESAKQTIDNFEIVWAHFNGEIMAIPLRYKHMLASNENQFAY